MTAPRMKAVMVAVALLALGTLVVWEDLRVGRLLVEAAALREQAVQAAQLQADIQQLTGQLKTAAENSQADRIELARLRAQVAKLRQTEQELSKVKARQNQEASPPPLVTPIQPDAGPATSAVTQSLLTAWQQGDISAAVGRFLTADWNARPLFTPGSTLNLGEDQFKALFESLTPDEMKTKGPEMMAPLQTLKEVAAAVTQAGRAAVVNSDLVHARRHFTSLHACGEALDSPASLALVKLVGQGMKKRAEAELTKLAQ